MRHAWYAAHLALDWQGDAALYLLWSLTRGLGDDLHLHVLHIRKRLDRQVVDGLPAGNDQYHRAGDNEHALL